MQIVISTAAGQRDSFELPETFTYREMKEIRNISGYKPAELESALLGGDGDLVVALAVVAAGRAGVKLKPEELLDLEFGAITVEGDEEDTDPTPAAAELAAESQTIHVDGGDQPS